jgi:beta-glucosidase-like glycosyl hydrolase
MPDVTEDSDGTNLTITGADTSAENGIARVERLLRDMTLEEKLAQLVALWQSLRAVGTDVVAPLQDAMESPERSFEEFAAHGLGQLTRPFGTRPVEPLDGARRVAAAQRWLVEHTRMGIPAIVHEECLTGLATWRATTYPAPPSWGASFDPALVERMAAAIGEQMSALGISQGLAPVLDVIRDPRWGRVEECIAEDPYLVGETGTAYVRGLQSSGVVATLKHFVGYSNSRAGRNLAPVHAGRREVEDVLLVPFEMAVLDGGAGSVMHSYAEVDGVPAAVDPWLLTEVLRERWGFEGTVVADYFGIAFLQTLHRVAGSLGDAAQQALTAGVDVELPTGNAYLAPLAELVRAGDVSGALVDRAVRRVLRQKEALGLLDAHFEAEAIENIDVDPRAHRDLARWLAEESVILLTNEAVLPLAEPTSLAVVGPNADDPAALFGCYSFVNHVLPQHPTVGLGLAAPTVREALAAEFPAAELHYARGCDVDGRSEDGFAEAVQAAAGAGVCVAVVGDRAGLFGRGTSGEGCDTDSLELPGRQRQLVEAVVATGTPVVLVLVTGRPYAVSWAVGRCAAILQAFFPGEEGGAAIAGILSGRVNPSGHLPVSMPTSAGAQPYSYLHPPLGAASSVSNLDPKPVFAFGHGLSYTSFTIEECRLESATVPTDGWIEVRCRVVNSGQRAGAAVVQVYAHDVVASTTRPVRQLVGFARVQLDPGAAVEAAIAVPAARLALTGRDWIRVVEPGEVEIFVGTSSEQAELAGTAALTGSVHRVTSQDPRRTEVRVTPAGPSRAG